MKDVLNRLKVLWVAGKNYITTLDRSNRKRLLAGTLAVLVVAGLAVMPLLAATKDLGNTPESTLMTTTVTTGDLQATIHGSGNLAEEGAQVIRLPEGVKLTEFFVPNYAAVKQGDKLAGVDRVTVMQAISKTQESMDYLKEQLNDAETGSGTVQLKTETGGTVKAVYCSPGDEVGAVMMEHGALAVLSLDGQMAVDFPCAGDLRSGDSVTLRFADGTEAAGKVKSALDGEVTVTIADENYAMDARVTVLSDDGTELGSGALYVHNAWRAMGTTGIVSKVNIKENAKLKPDSDLMSLTEVDQSAEFAELSNKHRAYEQLLLELFVMYQNEAIVAPCDGIVTGIDRNSVHLLAADGGYSVSLLANAPAGGDKKQYLHYIGRLTEKGEDLWSLRINPLKFGVADYLDLTKIPLNSELMTAAVQYTPKNVVYEREEDKWVQVDEKDIAVGDYLMFAEDSDGKCVWIVRVPKELIITPTPTPAPTPVPTDPPEVTPNPDEILPGEDYIIDGGFDIGFGGGGGYYVSPEPPEMFDLEGTDILTVTPQDTMTLTISLKEQDIGKVAMGQTAQVKVGVMKGKVFPGKVTSIYSKTDEQEKLRFYVEVTLKREGDMLNGMSATAIFTGDTAEQVLLLPVAALNVKGSKTVIYTALSGGEPAKPVEVTTGISDGETVEILTGLTAGQTVYYEYYEAQEVSNAVASRGGLFW